VSEQEIRAPRDLDLVLLGAALALALVGIAFIHSAAPAAAGLSKLATRQAFYLGASLVALVLLLRVDYRRLAAWAPWIYGGALLLNVVTVVFGSEVGGNKAWLRLGGFSMQPSELAKVATVLMLATMVGRRAPGGLRAPDVLLQAGVVAAPLLVILLQSDTGTALTFPPLLAASLFVSGLRWRYIVAALVAFAVMAPVGWSALRPYQQDRLRTVVDPDLDPSGVGYHAIQSRVAVGSGGLLGQGYLEGPQNRHGFLPERHTDFIFAVVAEEWGFVGALAVLGLYLLLLRRLADAATLARDRVGSFLCVGALVFLSVHVAVNVGMVLALLPTIGIPLPLLSYGGTSLVATACLIALAANVRMRRFAR
jgi:rod shape determining protein RodA